MSHSAFVFDWRIGLDGEFPLVAGSFLDESGLVLLGPCFVHASYVLFWLLVLLQGLRTRFGSL